MECEKTQSLIQKAAEMKLHEIAEHCDFLAMKIETISIALATCTVGLKTLTKTEEVSEPARPLLMLPAPKQKHNPRVCPVCKKFLKKGEEIHAKCQEIRESKLPTCHGGVKRD